MEDEKNKLEEDLDFIYGKDEMNLAEFPLATLSKRIIPGTTKLVFSDNIKDPKTNELIERKLTISAPESHGLPTTLDDEVILGLIQLTKRQRFESKAIKYTRYQILKILGWKDNGRNFKRVKDSLEKWININLKYEKAWWNSTAKTWMDESFHILERISAPTDISSQEKHKFVWNEVFFSSLKRGNLKSLDLSLYRKLKTPTAKRLFRFLDKRFYYKKKLEFNLHKFAFQKLGMSNKYHTGMIKQKLSPAIKELEDLGFLYRMAKSERYKKLGTKHWVILFQKAERAKNLSPKKKTVDNKLKNLLIKIGIHDKKVLKIIHSYPEKLIREKIEIFNYCLNSENPPKNPIGYLIKSIEENYAPPSGFQSQKTQNDEESSLIIIPHKQNIAEKIAERRKEQEKQAYAKKVQQAKTYLESLEEAQREEVIAQALAKAIPWMISQGGATAQAHKEQLIVDYIDLILKV